MDKALTWESLATGHVDLPRAIDAWTRASRHLDRVETEDRAMRAITEMMSHGVTAVG